MWVPPGLSLHSKTMMVPSSVMPAKSAEPPVGTDVEVVAEAGRASLFDAETERRL